MRALICINTCNRPAAIRALVWDYVRFVKACENYDLVVSLDGLDAQTIKYCERFHIPLIFSDKQEGVGISKNRVLSACQDYDYYFFLEDDVELLKWDVFRLHVLASQLTGLHHLSLFESGRIGEEQSRTVLKELTVIHSMHGGAPVNFFTKHGIERVGGFHDEFAKYRRFGHTEHTCRFVNAGLAKYPFNVLAECVVGYFRWHNPRSVTRAKVETTRDRLFTGEQMLIDTKLTYYPVVTPSPYRLTIPIDKSQIGVDKWEKLHKLRFSLIMRSLGLARACRRLSTVGTSI